MEPAAELDTALLNNNSVKVAIDRFYEFYSTDNYSKLQSLVTEDFTITSGIDSLPFGGTFKGPKGFASYLHAVQTSLEKNKVLYNLVADECSGKFFAWISIVGLTVKRTTKSFPKMSVFHIGKVRTADFRIESIAETFDEPLTLIRGFSTPEAIIIDKFAKDLASANISDAEKVVSPKCVFIVHGDKTSKIITKYATGSEGFFQWLFFHDKYLDGQASGKLLFQHGENLIYEYVYSSLIFKPAQVILSNVRLTTTYVVSGGLIASINSIFHDLTLHELFANIKE